MKVYIGAENIISPLGDSAVDNFNKISSGDSGVQLVERNELAPVYLSKFSQDQSINSLIQSCFHKLDIEAEIPFSPRTKIILSSTKGNINEGIESALVDLLHPFLSNEKIKNTPLLISNACVSGVLAIVKGAEFIRAGLYDHVIVIGADTVSEFVLNGFDALFALSDQRCKPYDKTRVGINLGEAVGAVVLSNSKSIFKSSPLEYLSGCSTNDANHISGPSRTGEGLYRSIVKTIANSGLEASGVDHISAHGTATLYNDDMESIAFSRSGLSKVPINSLKAYFGHTLGAAGVIETAIAMQSIRNQTLVKSLGMEELGTVEPLNVIKETGAAKVDAVLKTASGFGGGNASLIIKNI